MLPRAMDPGAPDPLVRLGTACPRCGARPALRVTLSLVRLLGTEPAGWRIGTYRCQRRRCGAIYDVTVGAVRAGEPGRLAEPEPP